MQNNLNHGSLVISLDFEMMWGCHDWSTPDDYGATNISQVRTVVDKMLSLFKQYDVHATFATVGLIMCKDKNEAQKFIPQLKPSYDDINCSPYKDSYIADILPKDSALYFAPNLIESITANNGFEIGTHTFSHYFCWEKGQTVQQFQSDLQSAKLIAKEKGLEIKSIVFPKNQVSKEYLEICKTEGIISYRGNAAKFFNEPRNKWEGIKNRICRLLDAYFNIGGMSGVPYGEMNLNESPINLRASRMLRPYSPKLSFLEVLRIKRIKKEMIHAARNYEMYHLWWHPHNFGANMEQNLDFLDKVLQCYKECHEKYGMYSYTMQEMTNFIINK